MRHFDVIVIGGGHAGVEAAWAAANVLGGVATVALVTQDPARIGVMSCNPAIGGLAKGQMVREIDALGGIMGLAADAAGIQFKVLNTSKGEAVRGPRAQCDKHAYARAVASLIASRPEISVIAAGVERLLVRDGRITGVATSADELFAPAVVLTTGTFMRGLMHTGESQTPGGRFGEPPAEGISVALRELGFELGRLKTGTPPRLRRGSIRWHDLEPQHGDQPPQPFSDLSASLGADDPLRQVAPSLACFPVLPQVECRVTATCAATHELIRANLHRAPMYSGQIASAGPRYCPSLEDKVVRFAERQSHQVFLEPESLDDEWIYANGISTSLPRDVQDAIVRALPGCERAEILRYGYAVEYDMVRPHQLWATAEAKPVMGLFLAGQINGTSGYEEAAAQGLLAGLNAARRARDLEPVTLGREEAYLGVLMDDLATKTPLEPYRMFTSRAEHRLLLRADNAPDRLTPWARRHGLLDHGPLGALRSAHFDHRADLLAEIQASIDLLTHEGKPLAEVLRRTEFTADHLAEVLHRAGRAPRAGSGRVLRTARADRFYAAYVDRARAEVARAAELERRRIPPAMDFLALTDLRTEARLALARFRPATIGQAGRLEGLTPADVLLLSVLVRRFQQQGGPRPGGAA